MAGKSSRNGNWAPNSPATRYKASGKNREFYTFENAPGIGAYATGGTIIDGGDGYIYHIFTGDGTFTVNRPSAAIDSVDYLIVAGGGSAGPQTNVAGGGGGGFLFGTTSVSVGNYSVVVGGAGPSTPGAPAPPRNGNPSYFGGPSLEATGGGGGAGSPGAIVGGNGGSGGGAFGTPAAGGSGNTPAKIPRQGYPGGTAIAPNTTGAAGGGGGAGGVGGNASTPPAVGGSGGPGRIAPEFPSTIVRQAIPAPVLPTWEPLVSSRGYSVGGGGVPVPAPLQRTSPANSGYGGDGSTGNRVGGSGIVCIRYKKTVPYSRATGGTIEPSTHPEHPGVWRHIFTSPGDFTITDPTLQWIDYLAVGGGGGGGGSPTIHGGGGGAGGFVSSIHTSTTTPLAIPETYPWNPGYSVEVGEQYPVGVGTYPIDIGTGGNAATDGNNTTIGSPGPNQIIAAGGGYGGTAPQAGGAGGSGGGGAKLAPSTSPLSGGTATPTPLIQGNPGGSSGITPAAAGAGGGGGAGNGGTPATTTGNGGDGWYSVISPSAYGTPGPLTPTTIYRYFAGGGGGRTGPDAGTGGAGGGGGGSTTTSGTPGTTNTGGGGGGGTSALGGTGGPGIVIIQYPE
jgi:hypothetical protein